MLTDAQRELLNKLINMPVGTVLKKGERSRILLGLGPGMIIYSTPARPRTKTMQNIVSFMKWAEKAEIINEREQVK